MIALASASDVTARAPDLADLEDDQIEALIDDASAIVRAYAGRTWTNDAGDALVDVPDGITGVVAMMVIRALRVPEGITQEQIGNYSVSYATMASDRLYLTRAEKIIVAGGASRAFSITTHGEPGYLGGDW